MSIHPNSRESYDEHVESGQQKTWRRRIYDFVDVSIPMTACQIWKHFGEPDINNIRPEITRLKQDGLFEEVSKVRCEYTGRNVSRVKTTDKAYFDRKQKGEI